MIEIFIVGFVLGYCLHLIISKHRVSQSEGYVDAMEEIDRGIAEQESERWNND